MSGWNASDNGLLGGIREALYRIAGYLERKEERETAIKDAPIERDLGKTRSTSEPLIKDEKIRKAVRAWAEANDIERVWHEYSSCWLRGNGLKIELENEVVELEQGNYAIAELCGEEE